MKEGSLWDHSPPVQPSGLICALQISKFGVTNKHLRPQQRCRITALHHSRKSCTIADSSGNVYDLQIKGNRWVHVGRGTSAATSVHANPQRPTEIVAGFQDGSVVCLDSTSRRRICTLSEHKLPVHSVSFHSTGRLLATSDRTCAFLWDTRTWARKHCLKQPGHVVRSLKFTPSGKYLLALFQNAASQQYMFVAWDPNSHKVRFKAKVPDRFADGADIEAFASSVDDSALVCGCQSRPAVLYWDMEQLCSGFHSSPRIVALGGKAGVFQVAFAPDGNTLACGMQDGSIGFFAINTVTHRGEAVARIVPGPGAGTGHNSAFHAFCLTPSATLLVGCTSDNVVRLYDLAVSRASYTQQGARGMKHGKGGGSENDASARYLIPRAIGETDTTGIELAPFLQKSAWVDSIFKRRDDLVTQTRKNRVKTGHGGGSKPHFDDDDDEFGQSLEGIDTDSDATAVHGQARSNLGSNASGAVPQLARHLAPAQGALNQRRLLDLYNLNGRFPAKYRRLIWRFLLRIPEDGTAHRRLEAAGLHRAVVEILAKSFPIRNARLARTLQLVLSAVATWAPALGLVYKLGHVLHDPLVPTTHMLPVQAMFPFVKLFGTDRMLAFEMCASVLLIWCRGWFRHSPAPPAHQLAAMVAVARSRLPGVGCPAVVLHVERLGEDVGTLLWPLLFSVLSEALEGVEWLRLWDFLVCHPDRPEFLPLAAVAVMRLQASQLLDCNDPGDLREVLRRVSPRLKARRIVDRVRHIYEQLDADTVASLRPDSDSDVAAKESVTEQMPTTLNNTSGPGSGFETDRGGEETDSTNGSDLKKPPSPVVVWFLTSSNGEYRRFPRASQKCLNLQQQQLKGILRFQRERQEHKDLVHHMHDLENKTLTALRQTDLEQRRIIDAMTKATFDAAAQASNAVDAIQPSALSHDGAMPGEFDHRSNHRDLQRLLQAYEVAFASQKQAARTVVEQLHWTKSELLREDVRTSLPGVTRERNSQQPYSFRELQELRQHIRAGRPGMPGV